MLYGPPIPMLSPAIAMARLRAERSGGDTSQYPARARGRYESRAGMTDEQKKARQKMLKERNRLNERN